MDNMIKKIFKAAVTVGLVGAAAFTLAACSDPGNAAAPTDTVLPTVVMEPEATAGWGAYVGYMQELTDLVCELPDTDNVTQELADRFAAFSTRVQNDPLLSDPNNLGMEYGTDLKATAASSAESVQKSVGSSLDEDQKNLLKAVCESQQQYTDSLPANEPAPLTNPAPANPTGTPSSTPESSEQ